MGLDISGFHSDLTYHQGYGGIHRIRAIAVAIALEIPYKEAWTFLMDYSNRDDPLWSSCYYDWLESKGLLRFHQLLNFCDSEGMMIKGYYLERMDVRKSMMLGNLDRLYEELEDIRTVVTSNPDKYPQNELPMDTFWMLYNLVKDEAENGYCLIFH